MAVNFYLKLDAIPGECTDANYTDTIKIHSWSWGASNTATIGGTQGLSGGTVSMADIAIMKDFDKASPELYKAITQGTTIKSAVLTAVKSTGAANPAKFLEVTFTDCYITSQSLSASSEVPSESNTFAYAECKVEYFTQNDDSGSLTSTGAVSYSIKTKTTS